MSRYVWKINNAIYSIGKLCYLGKWHVGGFNWDSSSSRENGKKYKPACVLPGIKSSFDNVATEEEAIAKVESVVDYWLKNSGLEIIS